MTSFMDRIPFADFPKTFQDAITVSRALAVDYIWIDSICIVQDSKQDWDVQGSKMDQVYANCLLTLATDAAKDSQAGFLDTKERRSSANRNRRFKCQGLDGHEYEVFSRPQRRKGSRGGFGYHYGPRPLIEEDWLDKAGHLMSRAWCWQETILPPRVLHFLPDEITWKCEAISRCECQVEPHAIDHIHDTDKIASFDMKQSWETIVHQYTTRHLTFSSDRLVALAGLAAQAYLQRSISSPTVTYYAGAWSDTLPTALLWILFDYAPETRSQRIEPRLAPTWSWASIDGCIGFSLLHTPLCEEAVKDPLGLRILHISCPPSGINKYGNVDVGTAELKLEAILFSAHFRLISRERTYFLCAVTVGDDKDLSHGNSTATLAAQTGLFYPDTNETMEALEQDGKAAGLILINFGGHAIFIVVKRLAGAAMDVVYERVGVLWLHAQGMRAEARSLGCRKILNIA